MDIFREFNRRVNRAVEAVVATHQPPDGLDLSPIKVEPPRDPSHGDLSTNAAMVLAKPLSLRPRELAVEIAARLEADPDVDRVEVAGLGFINLVLAPSCWTAVLQGILAAGKAFGRSDIGGGDKVNIEYVSANPTGPMHVGHCRGAVVGDAVAGLMAEAGFEVTREYYINDAGAQVDALARSAYLRYREALGENIGPIPEGLYPGDYLKPVGETLAAEQGAALLEADDADWLPIVRAATIDAMMAMIRDDLAALNIRHDVFFSERSLIAGAVDRVAEAIAELRARDLIYVGRLPPPKGQPDPDWEDREQELFRSTAFGDDLDRPILKSDGSYTYFASDIAYHYDKYLRGFRRMVDVLGADHGGYVKRVQAAVRAVSGDEARLEVMLCQLVRLFRAGEPVKMSKRAGDFVTLREVVDEVGADAVRFMMVFRKNDAPLDFDFQKVTEQSKDNPVFYVQYAHARAASVFRQAASEIEGLSAEIADLRAARLDRLDDSGELAILRKLAEYPRLIEMAAQHGEPHRLAHYLHDLAAEFHIHWNRGKELPQLRFINHRDTGLTLARLALVHATKMVLASGLKVLGVEAPEEMR